MSDDLLQLQFDGTIATVTLDDPGRRNALGLAMFDAQTKADIVCHNARTLFPRFKTQ